VTGQIISTIPTYFQLNSHHRPFSLSGNNIICIDLDDSPDGTFLSEFNLRQYLDFKLDSFRVDVII